MSGWNRDEEKRYLVETFDQHDICVEEFRVCSFTELAARLKYLNNDHAELLQIIKEAKGWRNKHPILRTKVTLIENY